MSFYLKLELKGNNIKFLSRENWREELGKELPLFKNCQRTLKKRSENQPSEPEPTKRRPVPKDKTGRSF